VFGAPNTLPPLEQPKSAYRKLPAYANDLTTESSACLYLALTQGRGGLKWDAEGTLGASSVRDTDGDGVKEIVDNWGKAIYFVRYAIPGANPRLFSNPKAPFDPSIQDMNPPYSPWILDLNPNGLAPGTNDTQDPDGLLSNPTWANSALGTSFGAACHPVAGNASWANLSPFVASAGANRIIGDNDDRFSYRLKSAGSGGQR
jgi:hypothetical protein